MHGWSPRSRVSYDGVAVAKYRVHVATVERAVRPRVACLALHPHQHVTLSQRSERQPLSSQGDPQLRTIASEAATYQPEDRYVLFELLIKEARCNGYGDVTLPDPGRWAASES